MLVFGGTASAYAYANTNANTNTNARTTNNNDTTPNTDAYGNPVPATGDAEGGATAALSPPRPPSADASEREDGEGAGEGGGEGGGGGGGGGEVGAELSPNTVCPNTVWGLRVEAFEGMDYNTGFKGKTYRVRTILYVTVEGRG